MLGIIGVVVNTPVVGVGLSWNAEAFDIVTPEREDAVRILRRGQAEHHAARRVVNGDQEATGRGTTFEPIMGAAIELEERANTVTALTLLAVRTSFARASPEAFLGEPAGGCLPRDLEVVVELELFSKQGWSVV